MHIIEIRHSPKANPAQMWADLKRGLRLKQVFFEIKMCLVSLT